MPTTAFSPLHLLRPTCSSCGHLKAISNTQPQSGLTGMAAACFSRSSPPDHDLCWLHTAAPVISDMVDILCSLPAKELTPLRDEQKRLKQTQSALTEVTYWLKLISTGKLRVQRSLPHRVTKDLSKITRVRALSVLKAQHKLSLLVSSNHTPNNGRLTSVLECFNFTVIKKKIYLLAFPF